MSDQPACWSLADPAIAWDVDVLTDNSVFVSGIDSLKFPSRSPGPGVAPEMIGDCDTSGAEEIIPCSPNTPILVEGVARGDSTTATNKVRLAVDWLDSSKALMSTSDVFNAAVTAANTWETKSGVVTAPASTAFYRIRFGKSNTAFNAWWDSVKSSEFPISFKAKPSSNQNVTTGDPTDVSLGTEVYDNGNVFGSSTFTAPCSGIYVFSFNVLLTNTTVDEAYTALLWKNGATVEAYGWSEGVGSGMSLISGSFPILLSGGDTIGLRVNSESDASYSVYADTTFLTGALLR